MAFMVGLIDRLGLWARELNVHPIHHLLPIVHPIQRAVPVADSTERFSLPSGRILNSPFLHLSSPHLQLSLSRSALQEPHLFARLVLLGGHCREAQGDDDVLEQEVG